MILDGAVTESKIADNAITTNKIIDNSVTTNKIADDSVTADKLSADAIPTMSASVKGIAKVGAGLSMNGDALELDGSGDIATAVTSYLNAHPETTTTVQDGSITTDKLADGAATDSKLAQTGGVLEDVAHLTDGLTELSGYVVGTLNNSGILGWGPYAISTADDVTLDRPVVLHIASGYQYLLLVKYNGSDTYSSFGYIDFNAPLPANTPFKVTVRKTGDTTTPADIPVMSRKLLVLTSAASEAKRALAQSEKLIDGQELVPAYFQNGSLSATSGNFSAYAKYRIATPFITYAGRTLNFHIADGFKMAVFKFTSDETVVSDSGWQTGSYTVESEYGFKVQIARVTEDTSEFADYDTFYGAISVDTAFKDYVDSITENVFTEPYMQASKPLLVAHMGYHASYPENTIPSFKAAGELGMWGIETDLQQTADGKFVCIHDFTLDRTTNGTGNVADKTLAEIRALHIKDHPELQVPTLEEYLGVCKAYGCVPVPEIKQVRITPDGIAPIIQAIKDAGLYNKCILIGSQWTAASVRDADKHIPYIGVFQHGAYSDYEPGITFMKQFDRCGVALEKSGTITSDMIKECHAANMPVIVFVVDDKDQAFDWFALGADMVTTNLVTSLI